VSTNVPVPHDDFAEFYQASYGRVVALVAAIVGEQHQAEDIAQEAFARALTRWSRVARYDLPEAWVRRVALRLTIDAGRRTRRAFRLSARLAANPGGAHGLRGVSDPYDPRDPLVATALSVALMRLPLPQRQALVLYYLADLPVDDIARDCGVSVGTIRTRLAAARHRLERELAESESESESESGSGSGSRSGSASGSGSGSASGSGSRSGSASGSGSGSASASASRTGSGSGSGSGSGEGVRHAR